MSSVSVFLSWQLLQSDCQLSGPRKFLVTTVWNDMVHNRCPDVLALLGTLHTEWMSFQIRLSGFLPPPVVSTLRCRTGDFRVERQVLLTVEPADFHQLRAAGMTARCLWSVRHGSVLPRKTSLCRSDRKH